MSVCGQTEEDSASEEVGAPATRDIYKQKPASKVVRVLTVLAYLLSVSLAAILLSVYYICVWKSPELPLEVSLNDTGEMNALRSNRTEYPQVEHAVQSHSYGGGDTAVIDDSIQTTPENITSGFLEKSVSTEPTTDVTFNSTDLPDTTPGLHNGTTEDIDSFNGLDSIT